MTAFEGHKEPRVVPTGRVYLLHRQSVLCLELMSVCCCTLFCVTLISKGSVLIPAGTCKKMP